jgi:hypothetical protein
MGIPGPKNKIVIPNGIVVWLDVDDVLVDFHKIFNSYARRRGHDIPVHYMPERYSYAEVMSEKEFITCFNGLGDDWPARVHALDGAAEFTRQLSEMGCRVILITSVNGYQGPERIQNLCKNKIYFDEIYLTRGRRKGEFASWLSTRYVDSRGRRVKSILVDDYAKNAVEFVRNVPNSSATTLGVGYSKEWVRKYKHLKRIDGASKNQKELYDATFKMIAKLLTKRPKVKKKRKSKKSARRS